MREAKCEGCSKNKAHAAGWSCCMGNHCELDVRNKTIEKFVKFIDKHTHENGTEICLDDITILAEEFLRGEE